MNCSVSTNIISNKELFLSSIVSGKWDYVLQQVSERSSFDVQISTLMLPKTVLVDLYEQIFYELLEIREMFTANELLTKCEPLVMMKTEMEERYCSWSWLIGRYLNLQYWLKKSYFDPVEAYPAGETKESRRQKLASLLSSYVSVNRRYDVQITVAPSSRLLTLLQQALCYEKEKGLLVEGENVDIFRNCVESVIVEDAIPTVKVIMRVHSDSSGIQFNSPKGVILRLCVYLQMVNMW